ncbi:MULTISPECIES: hypothetical protein [Streptomyces]|uniref:Uncharacterized protein n=1 Tax=Streptomyces bugieae TaxID=3098223 RepID=A0ABU7NQR5_9ACTN|nr:hypothetical protein [Streptomyces nigrescens]MEE4421221.1 hypothetical protein [Streptomyces sp. DSM 41528]
MRLSRTVAVRRALLTGLFLVGFAVLGFALGPGARADDRAGSPAPSGATSPAQAPAAGDRTPADRTTADRTDTDRSAGVMDRTAADRTSTDRSPADRATPYRAATRYGSAERAHHESWAHRSAGSGTAGGQEGAAAGARITAHADTATTELTDAVRPAAEQAGPIAGTVTRPVTGAVGEIGDAFGGALPVQLPSVERPGRPGHGGGSPHDGGVTGGDRPAGAPTAAPADGLAVVPPAHCVQGKARQAAPQLPSAVSGQRDADRHGLPERQLPQGPTAPAPQPHSAGDQHGPRGGDQHAAAPADAPRFRLLPGGVRTADGAPTRRRAEEILEFPG